MIDHPAIERRIVDALLAADLGLPVEASPEEPLEYVRLLGLAGGAVVVSYAGTDFSEFQVQGFPPSGQDARVRFDVNFAVHDLRSHAGVYTALNKARAVLTGLEVADGAPLRCVRDGFVQLNENLWLFTATYEALIQEESAGAQA